ncbi:MAG: zinc ribbon domain-containing protein [Rhodanobacter sp.]|nr:MAG: zinc ribbon domain-containing protein [Rhodanobacter sp.]
MHCPKCGSEHESKDRFCRNCGTSLSNSSIQNTSTSGDQSFNAGQHNVITGNHISVGGGNSDPVAYIDRVKTTPITLGGHPVKVVWVIISSVLGIVGSIASIWSAWATTYQFLWLLILVLSGTVLLIGIALSRMRFARLPPFINLESNRSGEIFFTKIEGSCPKCDGVLKLREVGPKDNKYTIARCTRNPDHYWHFDPTVLGEP